MEGFVLRYGSFYGREHRLLQKPGSSRVYGDPRRFVVVML